MQNFAALLLQRFGLRGLSLPKVDSPEHAGRHHDPDHPSRKHDQPPSLGPVAVQPPHTVGGPRRRDRRPEMVRAQAARRQATRESRRAAD